MGPRVGGSPRPGVPVGPHVSQFPRPMVFTRVRPRSWLVAGPEPPGPFSGTGGVVMARRFTWGAATSVAALVVGGLTLTATPQAQAADWSRCLTGSTDRQAVFERASRGQRRAGRGPARRLLPGVPLGRPRPPGEHLRRLRPDAPHPGRGRGARPRARRGQGRRVAGRPRDRHAHPGREDRRRHPRPAALRRRRQRLRRRRGARVLPARHHLGPSGRVEQGGRLVRRHRRRTRTGWTSPGRSSR